MCDDDEHPQRLVYLDAFYIDKYEVTNAQFKNFVDATGYVTDAEKRGGGHVWIDGKWKKVKEANWKHPLGSNSSIKNMGQHPVVQLTWNDAVAYTRWAGKRLPTEAEWEKAARGKDGRRFPWGNNRLDGTQCNYADRNSRFQWTDQNADDGFAYTSPIGHYENGKSPYGLYDMAGNVWEIRADWMDQKYYGNGPTRNPKGPSSGELRVLRGGSWHINYYGIRSANRGDL